MERFLNKLAEMLGALDPNSKPQSPCPFCGKVHAKAGTDEGNTPQVPEYDVSDGKAGSYEFIPRPISAIQLLPENFPSVMEFMYNQRISFAYCTSLEKGTPHFHVLNEENGREHLNLGEWLVVENSQNDPGFEVYVWNDYYFRTQLQPVQFVRDINFPTDLGTVPENKFQATNLFPGYARASDVLDVEEEL